MSLNIGDPAPDFNVPITAEEDFSLKNCRGQKVVLYFYPKDDTPGCTKEACDFRDHLADFDRENVHIIGISKDNLKKHAKFKDKHALNFVLGADEAGNVCEAYGVWVEKSMYGKKYMGIERATFLIDETGHIAHIWRKVKVAGHVEEILNVLKKTEKTT
jgi:peroxiredoxin Q/BCP